MTAQDRPSKPPVEIGWCEYVSLPELGLGGIKAKIDTGARSCSLHAEQCEPFKRDGVPWVRFAVPIASEIDPVIEAELVGERLVKSSNGLGESRYVIRTPLLIGNIRRNTVVTLTDRQAMEFPMLVGRAALGRRFLVNVARKYVLVPEPGPEPLL